MINNISNMTDDELREHLEAMRLQRKVGYEPKKRQRRDNPFADLDSEIAAKILKEFEESKKKQNG